jgi:MOSC domain-containing protein YiiM/GNAT superfamily N-acetyltransferase
MSAVTSPPPAPSRLHEGDPAARLGSIVQVNVSPGGVPKTPVPEAYVGLLGLSGDAHHAQTEHGGPRRAVCLMGIEAIGRVAAEGHPIAPGTSGENLTTEGLELSLLPLGSRLAIGTQVVLELTKPTSPCRTIRASFRDGRFARLSSQLHPADSRVYARVLREGLVRPGDPVQVLAPRPGTPVATDLLLDRIEGAERRVDLALWRAARRAGHEVHILDDGELVAAAAPALPGPPFNHARGLRDLPHATWRVLRFYRRHRTAGTFGAEEAPWPGAQPTGALAILAGDPARLRSAPEAAGLVVRSLDPEERQRWMDVLADASSGLPAAVRQAFHDLAPHWSLAGRALVGAELDGELVGVANITIRAGLGLLGGAAVMPEARGRGVQRALIAARARHAALAGCDTIAALAELGSPSERNLLGMGLKRVAIRHLYRYDPALEGVPGGDVAARPLPAAGSVA